MKLSCFLGLHSWKYHVSKFENLAETDLISLEYEQHPTIRVCEHCNYTQQKRYHHFGVGGNNYTINWLNISNKKNLKKPCNRAKTSL